MSKRVAYHILLIVIGFLGIFLGTLPDLFPQYISLLPNLKKYDAGLRALEMDELHDVNQRLLKYGEDGYLQITKLLKSFDPISIPSLKIIADDNRRLQQAWTIASVKSGMKWSPQIGSIPATQSIEAFVFICIKTDKGIYKPICDIRDLKNLVREAKVRFWSRTGFFFAFIALVIGEGIALKDAFTLKHRNQK